MCISTILFSIFINKLVKEINASGIGIKVKNKKLAVLLYADDIVILANNSHDLKKGLKIATNFGKKWRCKYNAKKTQVVIFGKKTKEKTTGKSATKELTKLKAINT